ncbi:MAG: methyltransferase domain-containing protein [Nitrososphaeraceae archaeon]
MIKNFLNTIPKNKKIILELGMGDGKLLNSLSKNNFDCYFIGVEIKEENFNIAKKNIKSPNVMLLNYSFETILPSFNDESIYKIISVLPDPKYIDKTYKHDWEIFYKTIYKKLQKNGLFILITEITNELLQPVTNNYFYKEVNSLKQIFKSIGFNLLSDFEGIQEDYFSSYLQLFSGDPLRIRIINFEFTKY